MYEQEVTLANLLASKKELEAQLEDITFHLDKINEQIGCLCIHPIIEKLESYTEPDYDDRFGSYSVVYKCKICGRVLGEENG